MAAQSVLTGHEDVHHSFSATAHQQSLTPIQPDADNPPPGLVQHEASGRSYQIDRKDGKLWHHESKSISSEPELALCSYEMAWQVGSGNVAHSYLFDDDGILVQSPLTWFSKKKAMGHVARLRSAEPRVVPSSSRIGLSELPRRHIETVEDSPFRYRILESSIGCERCHGPGQLHVDKHSNSTELVEQVDRTIVNPRHLSRELAEAICSQCHLQGDVQVVPSRQCS